MCLKQGFYGEYHHAYGQRSQVEKGLLRKITRSLVAVGNDLRVGNQRLYSNPKIINKTNRLQFVYNKDSRLTSSIQRWKGLQASFISTTSPKSSVCHPSSSLDVTWVPAPTTI